MGGDGSVNGCFYGLIKSRSSRVLSVRERTSRRTSTGSSLIVTASSNEDADLEMVKMLLTKCVGSRLVKQKQ